MLLSVGQPAGGSLDGSLDGSIYVGDRFAIEQGARGVERLLLHDESGQPAGSVSLSVEAFKIDVTSNSGSKKARARVLIIITSGSSTS